MDESSVSNIDKLRNRMHDFRTRAAGMIPFVSGVFAALLGLFLFNALYPNTQMTEKEVRDVVGSVMASATPRTPNAVQAFENVKYSIVVIEVKGENGDGFGTGVIFDEFGDILTSHHVIAGSSDISVTFSDGTKSEAVILSATPEQDIAILRAINMPDIIFPATLGSPGSVRVGDEVFVVGHPFGLTFSLSAGVVSGFDRSFQPSESDIRLEGLIQFDAAANPGNSGGPLLDQYGRVIGIVTGIIGPRNDNLFAGIGFAVPITAAAGGGGSPPY